MALTQTVRYAIDGAKSFLKQEFDFLDLLIVCWIGR